MGNAMSKNSDDLDHLYRAAAAVITPQPSSVSRLGQRRGGFGEGDLATLLVWNVLVAGFMGVACHLLGQKLHNALERKHQQLNHRGKRAAAEVRELLSQARDLLSQVIEDPVLRKSHVDEADRSQAVAAIRKILVDAGRPEEIAWQQADKVVHLLLTGVPADTRAS
jgi:hypothetical protein